MRLPPEQMEWGGSVTVHSDSGQLRGLSFSPLKDVYLTVSPLSPCLVLKLSCGPDHLKEPGQN